MTQEYTAAPNAFRNEDFAELTEGELMPSGIAVDRYGHVLTVVRSWADFETFLVNASGETHEVQLDYGETTMIVQMAGVPVGFNLSFEGALTADAALGWFPVPAVRTSNGTAETTTGVLNAVPAYAWRIDVRGLAAIRLKATAKTAGDEQVILGIAKV